MAYHHGDLAVALRDAAEALVREDGAHRWSLRAAAKRAGVSPSAAYHHYADRDALARAVAARHFERLTGAMAAATDRAGDDPDAAIAGISRAYVRWARRDPGLFEVAFGSGRAYVGTPVATEPFAILETQVERAGLAGKAPIALWSTMHGLAALAATGPLQRRSERDVCDEAAGLSAIVLAGLRGAAR